MLKGYCVFPSRKGVRSSSETSLLTSRHNLERVVEVGNDVRNVLDTDRHLAQKGTTHQHKRTKMRSAPQLTLIKSGVTPDASCSSMLNC